MRNLKISMKLIISYALVLLLLIVSIVVSIGNLVNIGSQVEDFYNGPFTVKGAANTLNANFEALQKSVFRAISTEDLAITQEALNNAALAVGNIQEQLVIVKEKFPGDPAIVQRLQDALTELAPHREHVLELAGNNQNEEAGAYMEANNIAIIKRAQVELNAIIDFSNQRGEDLIANLRSAQKISLITLITLGIASVVVSILFGAYITRSITRPLREVEAAAKQMAGGNLKIDVAYTSKDELGTLADNMRFMSEKISYYMAQISDSMQQLASGDLNVKKRETFLGDFKPVQDSIRLLVSSLNDTLSQINQSADQVSSGSDQVSSGAQALSQGATEQASSVEELAATITEISSQVKSTAQNAQQVRLQMAKAGDEVTSCNQQMQAMIQAMAEISDKSNEIGKIIKTIEDISFQTNILALNAAVEAARAGAAGKGFAVVADEVRNLANKSADASKNTSALIEGSIEAVEKGTAIANETAQSLQRVVQDTGAVTISVDKITEATNEQANSISQVTQGVDQISSVVQTNSATAEESAAASEELSGQAQMLKELVSRFKLQGSGGLLSEKPEQPNLPEHGSLQLEAGAY